MDQFKKESSQERTRATRELTSAKKELQSRVDELADRLSTSQTAASELEQQHVALIAQHKEVQDDVKGELKRGAEASATHAMEMARMKEEFAERTEELTMRLATEHTKAESALRAGAAGAELQAHTLRGELQAEYDACQKKLALVEATNYQLQSDLKLELKKSGDSEKQHAIALRAAMMDAAASLEIAKEKIARTNADDSVSLKAEFAQETKKYDVSRMLM